MHKFTHIGAFYQVARYVEKTNEDPSCPARFKIHAPVSYCGRIKLHGCNAGVVCRADALVPQSRNRTLSVESDNYGFAAFIARADVCDAIRDIERSIRTNASISPAYPLVLFGEWIGPGVQRGVAINGLPHKQWVLFAAQVIEGEEARYLDALPQLGERHAKVAIFSLADAPEYRMDVDFAEEASKEAALRSATELTAEVALACPWAERFGVTGPGEGLVWMPLGAHANNTSLFFKTKGEKHKVTKSQVRKPKTAPEAVEGVVAFVRFSVTPRRLDQGMEVMQEMGRGLEIGTLGPYLRWVCEDVRRECAFDLAESGLEWKTVHRAVAHKARAYFVEHLERSALR